MMSGVVFIILVAFAFISSCEGNESFPQRYCIDPQCSGPISRVSGQINYNSDRKEKLSFRAGQKFNIYGKLVGEDMEDFWIAEINGKKGYVRKNTVKEYEMLHKGDLTLVPSNLPENSVQDERNVVKPEDSVNEAVTSDKVFRSTDPYEVFEGTTIPFHQMTATATGSTGDAAKEMETSTIQPTSSIFSQYSDTNTLSNMQSEMSPITPTTMTKKTEEAENLSSIDNVSSESKISNVFDSVMKSVSDLVSGESKDTKKDHETETPPTEGMSSADNDGQGEANVPGKSSELKGGETESSDLVNDNKEAIMDSSERDLEEEEEDDDEGDDDDEDDGGGGDEEEEEDEVSDEELGEANEELSNQMEYNTELNEERQRSSVQNVEKTVEVVKSTVSVETQRNSEAVDFEAKKLGVDDSFEPNKTESLEEVETAREVPSSTSESISHTDSVHLERKDIENKAAEDVHHSSGDSKTLPPNYLPNSETSNIYNTAEKRGDATLYRMIDKSTPSVENSEHKSAAYINAEGGMMKDPADTIDQHEEGDFVTGQNLDQDSDGSIASQNELRKDDNVSNSEQNVFLQDKEQTLKDEELTSESALTYSAEKSFQQSSGEPDSTVDTNEKSSVTSAEMSHSEPTTVSPHYEGKYPEQNVEISTPPSVIANEHGSSEESFKQEIPVPENAESNPVNDPVQPTVEEHLVSQIDNNQLEQKELDEEIKNVEEAVDKSGSESNLSISDESSGIFSMIFSPLYTGYDYVLDAVFGKSDEIEVITESIGNVNLVGNSDVSDNILNQLEGQKRAQDLEGNAHNGISSNDHCEANPSDSFCRKSTSKWPSEGERSSEYQESKSWIDNAREEYQNPFDINNPSYYGALLFSTAVGGMLVCFFLGKYYMEGKKSDALLVAKLNVLEKKLMVSSTECLILKDKLRNADDSSEMIESLRSEVDKLQNEKNQLEKELEVAAEAGLEMDHMVSQCLSSQQACESLMESIEQLRLQANQQQSKTSSLENNLVLKTQENETLTQELKIAEEKIAELSSQLKKVEADLIQKEEEHHEKYDELRKLYDNQKKQYEEDLRNKTVEAVMVLTKCNSLEATLNETKESLAVKENEIAVLQECLEKINTSNGEEQGKVAIRFQDMLDFGKLKAELTSVSKERDRLKEELQGEEEARKLLEDHVKVIKEEVEKLRKSHEAAERDKAEAQTRLEVLSSYFKEKETQLQKELGAQIQKYTDASSVVQHMRSLEEEVENYRSQNEALKNEILDQERGYKSQLSTIEKKARENWLAARQAERKLEESKQEAGQLRNRLTMLSKTAPQSVSQNGDDSKQNISVMDSNGELSASPLHMGLASNSSVDSLFLDPNSSPPLVSGGVRMPPLMPPPPFPPLHPFPPMSPYHHPISPPLSFVPPPPPEGMYPQSVDGHRPPPLGRMSSPPPPPSPSHSPHLHHANSRPGKYASPFQDRKGERKSASPPTDMYRGMPIDDRGHMDEWGRYRTPPPHPTHLPDYPPFPYPHPRQHWEDDSMHPTSSFRPLPSQAEAVREKKGGKSKDNHPTEMENLEKANRYGGKQ